MLDLYNFFNMYRREHHTLLFFYKNLQRFCSLFAKIKNWAVEFKYGYTSFQDDPYSGHPKDCEMIEAIDISKGQHIIFQIKFKTS